jgi:SAM-dependent methyltransferase
MAAEVRSANQDVIDTWNGPLFDKFMRYRQMVTEGIAHHGDAALKRHPPKVGSRVLDVACGFGDTTLWLGSMVGPEGRAVGIDAAPRFIDVACKDAVAAGSANVAFRVADAQSDDLGGPYSYAFSRFGTMFFSDPVAALKNIRSALEPGGRVCFVVWRRREDNLFQQYSQQIVDERTGTPSATADGPGPFSMASADLVSDQLRAAGFTRIGFERHDRPIQIGRDLDDAVEFALELGPVGEHLRLTCPRPIEHAAIGDALRAKFQNHIKPDGVWLPSSTWFVTAVRRERH